MGFQQISLQQNLVPLSVSVFFYQFIFLYWWAATSGLSRLTNYFYIVYVSCRFEHRRVQAFLWILIHISIPYLFFLIGHNTDCRAYCYHQIGENFGSVSLKQNQGRWMLPAILTVHLMIFDEKLVHSQIDYTQHVINIKERRKTK